MLHIRCGGRVHVHGRRVIADRPLLLRQQQTRITTHASLVTHVDGTRELTLPDIITSLHITDTAVIFAAGRDAWTAPDTAEFRIVLVRSRIYNLPDFLAAIVYISSRDDDSAIYASTIGMRSNQRAINVLDCTAGTITGIDTELPVSAWPARSRANFVDINARRHRMRATPMDRALRSLLLMPILVAHGSGDIERAVELIVGGIAMTPVTDDTAPDPTALARSALADRVERLQLLASVRGHLYTDETELLAWLRAARPKLVERIGAHELIDAVAEAAVALESVCTHDGPRPPPTLPLAGETPCNLCCEHRPTVKVCERCIDSTICEGCADRLVLDTDKPACPLCRGPLRTA